MRVQHRLLAAVLLLQLCFVGSTFALVMAVRDTVETEIPDTLHAKSGELIEVPVNLLRAGRPYSICGFYFVLAFDPKVLCLDPLKLQCADAIHEGTLGEPLGKPMVQMIATDKIAVGAVSTSDTLTGRKSPPPLTKLLFRVIGQPGDTTGLRFVTFELSDCEGNATPGITHDGFFRVDDGGEKLIIGSKVAIPGAMAQKLPIRLENKKAICGIQLTAKFDRRFLKINKVEVADRTAGWEVTSHIFNDSLLNALLYHIPNDSLTADTTAILNINFDARGNAPLGDTTHVRFVSALASDCAGKKIDLLTQDGYVVFGRKGDLDADGDIDLTDLDILVNIIVNPSLQTPYTRWAGDLDDNGVLDIRDVILLNNLIYPGSASRILAEALRKAAASLFLHWGEWRNWENEALLPLLATIAGEVKGLQFTLRGEAIRMLGPVTLAINNPNLRVASGRYGDEMIVLVYGVGEAVLPPGEVELLHFASASPQEAFLEIANQIAVASSGQELATAVLNRQSETPISFRLLANYPNPFREATTFQFELAKAGDLRLEIFDTLGRSVATVVRRNLTPGLQQVQWDGRDGKGKRVPAGVYHFEIRCNDAKVTGRLLVLP